jgi:hypothetical protein
VVNIYDIPTRFLCTRPVIQLLRSNIQDQANQAERLTLSAAQAAAQAAARAVQQANIADAQAIAAAITAALQPMIAATTAATVAPAAPVTVGPAVAPIPFACTLAQARADLLDHEPPEEAKTYLTSKPAAGTTQSGDKPKAPAKAPTKEPPKAPTKTSTKALTEAPTNANTEPTSKLVAKATAKPATTLNATTKLATTFSVDKTNVSIWLTELGDHNPRDSTHLHQEKKLPATIQEKKSTPTKKINFAKAALAASEAVDQEKGGTESEMSQDPVGNVGS